MKEITTEIAPEFNNLRSQVMGAIARGYCSDKNAHKTLDPDLCFAIGEEVLELLKSTQSK